MLQENTVHTVDYLEMVTPSRTIGVLDYPITGIGGVIVAYNTSVRDFSQ